jgi:GNAT superfamily N-acetyltransferase
MVAGWTKVILDNSLFPAQSRKMEVNKAVQNDIPELCELLALLFALEAEFQPDRQRQAAGLRQILDNPELGQILVARDGAICVGMVNLLFTVSTALGGRVAILEDMIVHPTHRHAGIGTRLIQAAIQFSRSAGCRRVTLLTDQDNISAQRFYTRHGFAHSEMIPMRMVFQPQ